MIFAVPLNPIPLIVRDVWRAVAVDAFVAVAALPEIAIGHVHDAFHQVFVGTLSTCLKFVGV